MFRALCFINLPSDVIGRDFLGGGGLGEEEHKQKEKCLSTPDQLLWDESSLDEEIAPEEMAAVHRKSGKSKNEYQDCKQEINSVREGQILHVTEESSPALNLHKKPLEMTSL